MKKAYLNWSSGKDATLTLFVLQQDPDIQIDKLVTTLDSTISRISMHGIPKELLLQQCEQLGIPLHIIDLPGHVPLDEYNRIMLKETSALLEQGFTHSVFGDIFLEDLRKYREEQLAIIGIKTVFPLWKMDTGELIRRFIKEGFKAIIVCINARVLDKSFCGRMIDEDFLADLPENVDPCGENGEFHTFVFDGPIFKQPVAFSKGGIFKHNIKTEKQAEDSQAPVKRTWESSFWYCDLI